MLHYVIEIALLLLVAYAVGVIVGWILRSMFGSGAAPGVEPYHEPAHAMATAAAPSVAEPVASVVTPPPPPVSVPTVVRTAPEPTPVETVAVVAAEGKADRPKGIAAARGGKADKLQRISGVGPKNEKILHGLGVFHFDQIAGWTREQVAWVDEHLKFNGRIAREDWITQAHLLAEGKEAEFTKKFGSGGVKNAAGQKTSGTRTRKS